MLADELRGTAARIEKLPVAAAIIDLATFEVVAVNAKAVAFFGGSANDLIGTSVWSRILPEESEAARTALSAMATKAVDGFQVQRDLVTSDGQKLTTEILGQKNRG